MGNWPYYFDVKERPLRDKYSVWRETAKGVLSPKARLRLEWIILYETKFNRNAALTCRYFGIARKTFYHWYNRFDDTNLTTLENGDHTPHTTRAPEYTPLEERRVLELRRKYPTAGRDKLVVLYLEDYGEAIKPWSMRRIVHDRKLYAKRAVKNKRQRVQSKVVRKKRITELQKKPFPGFLIEVDTIVFYDYGTKRYLVTAVDYASRLALGYMYATKSSRNAADFLKRLYLLFGRIENIHIDNGSEFQCEFEKAAEKLGVILYHARPHTPQDKPLIERFNGTIQQEYIDLGNYTTDVEEFNRNLVEWLVYYNFKRPHHSLGLKRPAEFATIQRNNVLPILSPITMP
jgi:transposase InsO family protein